MNAHTLSFTLPLPGFETPQRPRLLRSVPPTPPPSLHPQPQKREAWLAIRLPQWPLFAALHGTPKDTRLSLSQRPLVVVDDDRFRSVLCCNEFAFSRGVRPGHRLNAAIALCSQLECLSRDLHREQRLLEALALDCQRFTPIVVVEPPDELILEVRGSLKLFGGVHALLRRIDQELRESDIPAVLAISRTLRSAQWFARASHAARIVPPTQHTQALANLPLHVLQWPEEVRQRLRRFGVTHVGELLRLPRGGLARRIGKEYLQQLDQAQGRSPDIRHRYAAFEPYHDRILLDFEIETTTLAETLLNQRFERLRRFLKKRNAVLSELTISLLHRDEPTTRVPLGLAAPTADTEHLAGLLHETLATLRLPAPIREMRVEAPRWHIAAAHSADLPFNPHANRTLDDVATARARLLEQLRARLGREQIRRLRIRDDVRPHCTQIDEPAGQDLIQSRMDGPAALSRRPLWLLNAPQDLARHRGHANSCELCHGPERIQGGWWDGRSVDCDYFLVQSSTGATGWVYRDRLSANALYLHGLFG